jgi:hypothetical protein
LGKETLNFPLVTTPFVAGLPTIPTEINEWIHVVKAGVNYRF